MLPSEPILRRSKYLSAFAHMGDVYLYHDLYGYIMKMSPDVLDFLAAFSEPADVAEVCKRHASTFSGQSPQEFVDIFVQFSCLLPPDEDELEGIWHMVPVKSRWTVWKREDDGTLILYTAWGERPPMRHVLMPAEVALWNAFDGERRLAELRGPHDPALILGLVPRLVHHDVQALKLSAFPMSIYKGRVSLRPPYLTSTMPYPLYVPGKDPRPEALGERFSPTAYYREHVSDAEAQFEHQETTLSHLLRQPHPALRGRSYGQALIDALAGRGIVPAQGTVRVLEIGAGLGYVAHDSIQRMRERGLDVACEIVELSPALARAQAKRLEGLSVSMRHGDVLELGLPEAAYDLILANEMIGDLPAVELTRAQAGLNEAPGSKERQARLAELGDVGRLITELKLELDDAPDPFYLNLGALKLLGRLWSALAPGGTCIITEFGEQSTYPRLSSHLDHPELSIHFGHLMRAAESLGFVVQYEFVIDLLDFERTLEGMATTRSYFRALGMLLGEHGIELAKIGYTRDMFDALLAGKIARDRMGELYFDRIEDRLMGLTPHEFKALILKKRPAGA